MPIRKAYFGCLRKHLNKRSLEGVGDAEQATRRYPIAAFFVGLKIAPAPPAKKARAQGRAHSSISLSGPGLI